VDAFAAAAATAAATAAGASVGGCDLAALQLRLATVATVKAVAASAEVAGVADVRPVVRELSALGGSLCAVAHKRCCNNPGCANLSGPSELQRVKGRSNTCSGCHTAPYCSSICIKQHRLVCKALSMAAAAAGNDSAAAGPPVCMFCGSCFSGFVMVRVTCVWLCRNPCGGQAQCVLTRL
jgi:hypothetical protein